MINVGIVGANGQVGAELALYWANQRNSIQLTGLTRSEYGTTLLRLAGIPCETYDLRDREALRQRFGSFDLVADFSYPSGRATESIARFRNHVTAIVGAMKPGAAYVSMSSIMALGMNSAETRIRPYRVARSTYATIKRAGERDVARAGRASRVRCFSFRLGQVHGILQAVSQQLRQDLEFADLVVRAKPDDASIVVLPPTVCRALTVCAAGQASPGIYTVVEQPAWSVSAIYQLYERVYSLGGRVRFQFDVPASWSRRVAGWAYARLAAIRGPFEANVLVHSNFLHRTVKGWYRRRPASEPARDYSSADIVHEPLLGPVPGPFIPGMATEASGIDQYFRTAHEQLERCLQSVKAESEPSRNPPPLMRVPVGP